MRLILEVAQVFDFAVCQGATSEIEWWTDMQSGKPEKDETAFHCPSCDAYSQQRWYWCFTRNYVNDAMQSLLLAVGPQIHEGVSRAQERPYVTIVSGTAPGDGVVTSLSLSVCSHCLRAALWFKNELIWPATASAPQAHPKMPDGVRKTYDEARDISARSPRGAAALLRLAIQQLCDDLGQKGKSLDNAIDELVKQGLKPRVQQILDIVRVVGNNAVHPGKMDLKDDEETVGSLFPLVNEIVEELIAAPERLEALVDKLPEDQARRVRERASES